MIGSRDSAGFRSMAAGAWVALTLFAAPVAAQQLPYPALPDDARVTGGAPAAMDDLVETGLSPAEEEALIREARRRDLGQDYVPRPAIWKIADGDTTIYMFGTIHVLPPGFEWRSAGVDKVVAASDTLLLESLSDDPEAADAFRVGATEKGAPRLPPLLDRVSPAHRERLKGFLETLPAGAAKLMDDMPTWVAAMSVSFVRDLRAGEVPGPGADDWLEAHFKTLGKPIEAIEDSKAVVSSVNAVPEAMQVLMLEAALVAPMATRAELRAPAHAWAKGEVGPGSPLTIEFSNADGTSALSDPLLVRRNAEWAEHLQRRLDRPGTTLFAAGAGHFLGPGSLLELLERRGLKVERVE